eukprot:TRINITY_DN46056_c0_g1_i1.p1 TRINITY_DN46056_c0_g1~~TRINITY_DN46056_c0_g1_i1.p1  ORF type:complete len:310 (-),score=120.35 TRINITY_DN46056_c0_g1_i1:335-1234(-)
MSAGRPTLALSRKTPLKSKKLGTSSGKKKGAAVGGATVATNGSHPPQPKPWVETVTDLGQYKPSKEELEAKKAARKSSNKVLAKVSLADKRALHLDPDRHRLIQQQVLLDYRRQPSQNVEAILARSEQVMGICQGILNGEMITPTYTTTSLSPATSLPSLLEPELSNPLDDQEPGLDRLRGSAMSLCSRSGSLTSPTPTTPPVQQSHPPYMNSAALNEIAGELLITVRELREELLQEREARERLEREVVQQRELLSELAREVLRLQIHCSGGARGEWGVPGAQKQEANISTQLEGTRIV